MSSCSTHSPPPSNPLLLVAAHGVFREHRLGRRSQVWPRRCSGRENLPPPPPKTLPRPDPPSNLCGGSSSTHPNRTHHGGSGPSRRSRQSETNPLTEAHCLCRPPALRRGGKALGLRGEGAHRRRDRSGRRPSPSPPCATRAPSRCCTPLSPARARAAVADATGQRGGGGAARRRAGSVGGKARRIGRRSSHESGRPCLLASANCQRVNSFRGAISCALPAMYAGTAAPARGLRTPLTVPQRRGTRACACTPSAPAHVHRWEDCGRTRALTGSGLVGPRVARRLSRSASRRYANDGAEQPPSADDSLLREQQEREETLGGQTIWAWRRDLIGYVRASELDALRCRGCNALARLMSAPCTLQKAAALLRPGCDDYAGRRYHVASGHVVRGAVRLHHRAGCSR